MTSNITVTALVTAVPPFVHGPVLLDECETPLPFLVRLYPGEWKNLIESAKTRLAASQEICNLLRSLRIGEIKDKVIVSRVTKWMNYRLPTRERTFDCLVDLQKELSQLQKLLAIDLVQILWAREKGPSGEAPAERLEGVEIICPGTAADGETALSSVLPHVRGSYLWIVPSASLVPVAVHLSLHRILTHMEKSPGIVAYFDGSYSVVCRVSAFLSAAKSRGMSPTGLRELANICLASNSRIIQEREARCSLCQIEDIYGGNYPIISMVTEKRRKWWQFWKL